MSTLKNQRAETPKGAAARGFGDLFSAAVFKERKSAGGGEASYVQITQESLASMAAAAFEVGTQWRAEVAGAPSVRMLSLMELEHARRGAENFTGQYEAAIQRMFMRANGLTLSPDSCGWGQEYPEPPELRMWNAPLPSPPPRERAVAVRTHGSPDGCAQDEFPTVNARSAPQLPADEME